MVLKKKSKGKGYNRKEMKKGKEKMPENLPNLGKKTDI